MRTVTYNSVLAKACRLWGENPDDLSAIDEGKFRAFIGRRLRFAWEQFWWPELMTVEKRYVRPLWTAAAYAADYEVYHRPTDAVYRALRSVVAGNVPGESDYWGEMLAEYDWSEYDADLEPYDLGDIVWDPVTDRKYQLHTPDFDTPPPDTNRWGEIVELERYLDLDEPGQTPIGEVRAVYRSNPRLAPGADRVTGWKTTASGIWIPDATNTLWLDFRLRPPTLDGDLYSATATYDPEDAIYFEGDFYRMISSAATTAGESPVTAPTKWEKLEIPYLFAEYLAQGAYSDMLGKPEGQAEKFGPENDLAYAILVLEMDKIERLQGQDEPMVYPR